MFLANFFGQTSFLIALLLSLNIVIIVDHFFAVRAGYVTVCIVIRYTLIRILFHFFFIQFNMNVEVDYTSSLSVNTSNSDSTQNSVENGRYCIVKVRTMGQKNFFCFVWSIFTCTFSVSTL